MEPFVLHVSVPSAAQRRRHYVGLLKRPRVFAFLLFAALFPALLDRIAALFVPSEPLPLSMLATGFVCVLGLLVCVAILGEIAAFVRKLLGRDQHSLVFDDDGIREVVGRRVTERPWSWVAEAWCAGDMLVLSCHEPMRSLRLSGGARRHLLVDLRDPDAERLRQLLDRHRPGLLPPTR